MYPVRGQVSVERAILLGVVMAITVAVGWYMYTTFLAYIQSSVKISISQAIINGSSYLQMLVLNQGPVNNVTIIGVYVDNILCRPVSAQGPAFIDGDKVRLGVGGLASLTYNCKGFSGIPGTSVQGYLVLANGASFPFTAYVT